MLYASLAIFAFASDAPFADFGAIANKVNADPHSTWKACGKASGRFGSLEDVKTVLGARVRSDPDYVKVELPQGEEDTNPRLAGAAGWGGIPASFDARTVWGGNCSVVTNVRNQSACGSCWACAAHHPPAPHAPAPLCCGGAVALNYPLLRRAASRRPRPSSRAAASPARATSRCRRWTQRAAATRVARWAATAASRARRSTG